MVDLNFDGDWTRFLERTDDEMEALWATIHRIIHAIVDVEMVNRHGEIDQTVSIE